MKVGSNKPAGALVALLLSVMWAVPVEAQQAAATSEIPDKFNLDFKAAAKLGPTLRSQSTRLSAHDETARLVFEKLVDQVHPQEGVKFSWELRISNVDQTNAFSSPDGTIYVDRSLARLASSHAGLWAAVLSHEIAHVVRRDWARRFLYEKSLQGDGTALALGSPTLGSGAWMDTRKASENLASFCRQMEVDADAEGLMLMARAGFHPDFVAALNHLLRAQTASPAAASPYAMHPRWDTRDHQLERAYIAAGSEFDRLWPDRPASPGGNPPVVVFAQEPTLKSTGTDAWEIRVAMRCQNLAGAVEVVLRTRSDPTITAARGQKRSLSGAEFRQVTGCTSYKTLVAFAFEDSVSKIRPNPLWADIYVLDDEGLVLSRAALTLPR